MDYSSNRNYGARCMEYTHKGIRFLSIENELLKLTVCLDKGADITELIYKPMDCDMMWHAPGELRAPGKHEPTFANASGGYFDYYEGGWQEILPGGGPFVYEGAEIGKHGELDLLPWNFKVVNDTAEEVSVELIGRTVRMPFEIKKCITVKSGSGKVCVKEELTNEGQVPLKFIWAQHPCFGEPFLDSSCKIFTSAKKYLSSGYDGPTNATTPCTEGEWPMVTNAAGVTADASLVPEKGDRRTGNYHLYDIDEGWFAVVNANKKLGIGFAWDEKVFPYMTVWQDFCGHMAYPWYGRVYNMSVEFWNSHTDVFDLACENGSIRTIDGGETIETGFVFTLFEGKESVGRISADGEVF